MILLIIRYAHAVFNQIHNMNKLSSLFVLLLFAGFCQAQKFSILEAKLRAIEVLSFKKLNDFKGGGRIWKPALPAV
mgnify:CR=1 FL=1